MSWVNMQVWLDWVDRQRCATYAAVMLDKCYRVMSKMEKTLNLEKFY